MKITQIEIKNFRSIKDITIQPSELMALVGPNNAGKTNILGVRTRAAPNWPRLMYDRQRAGFRPL